MLKPAAAPVESGILGSQGPAPGIRRPARIGVIAGDVPNLESRGDGSIAYRTGRRAASSIVTSQPTLDPVTPLKTQAERMRGGNVDARA